MFNDQDSAPALPVSRTAVSNFHDSGLFSRRSKRHKNYSPWRLVTSILEGVAENVYNQLLNNDKMAIHRLWKSTLYRLGFSSSATVRGCKLLLDLDLAGHHKILGLFLDRPQEVAVMSLPHEEV